MALDTPVCLLHSTADKFRLRQQAHIAGHYYRNISVNIRVKIVAVRLWRGI